MLMVFKKNHINGDESHKHFTTHVTNETL